jgi:arylsulfatase A-like enzyme
MSETSRREFLKVLGQGAAAVSLVGGAALFDSSCSRGARRSRPNIVLLFSDDQRFDAAGALGNPAIRTPNLDKLAERGVTFSRAHIMGGTSGAVCMPSRAMLLTGRTLFHLQDQGGTIPVDHTMLPEALKAAGYETYGIGKWHNGKPAFARAFGGGGPVFFGGMSDHLQVPVFDFDPTGEYPAEKRRTGTKFSSELFTDAAVEIIRGRQDRTPFFLYVAYTAPHDPRMAPAEYAALYPPEKIALPPNFLPRHPFDNGEMSIRDELLAASPRDPAVVREHIAAYYAMITHLDAQIGRIFSALEETGLADETIVVFAGDNGLALGQHGLLGKQNLYDHSVRVPLVFAGPGFPRGRRRTTLCDLLDIYPTLFEALGLPLPASVEGLSLMPSVQRAGRKIRDFLFLAYTKIQRGIRTDDDWKLIEYNVGGTRTTQLFHLADDPWEMKNLAGDPAHGDRVASLRELLRTSMRESGDFCDFDKPNWGLPVNLASGR